MTPYETFRHQQHSRAQGRAAEDDAVQWLVGEGFDIVARNVAYRAGELDVVALEGDTLCFVEIKARTDGQYGGALRAVDGRKQRQIAAAAALYLATSGFAGPCRFDVLAMDGNADGWRFTLIRAAFELG